MVAMQMKYRRRRYYLYKIYESYQEAHKKARQFWERRKVRYQLISNGRFTELWLSRRIN